MNRFKMMPFTVFPEIGKIIILFILSIFWSFWNGLYPFCAPSTVWNTDHTKLLIIESDKEEQSPKKTLQLGTN